MKRLDGFPLRSPGVTTVALLSILLASCGGGTKPVAAPPGGKGPGAPAPSAAAPTVEAPKPDPDAPVTLEVPGMQVQAPKRIARQVVDLVKGSELWKLCLDEGTLSVSVTSKRSITKQVGPTMRLPGVGNYKPGTAQIVLAASKDGNEIGAFKALGKTPLSVEGSGDFQELALREAEAAGLTETLRLCAATLIRGRMGSPEAAERLAPGLVRALDDREPATVTLAAQLLGELGPGAVTVVPALASRLSDTRVYSEKLLYLGPNVEGSGGQQVGKTCARALAHFGAPAGKAIAITLQMDGAALPAALEALDTLGEDARPALPILIERLSFGAANADRVVRARTDRILELIARIGPEPSSAEHLGAFLVDGVPVRTQALAIRCLGLLGPAARPALARLTEIVKRDAGTDLGDQRHGLYREATIALGKTGPDVLPAVRELLGTAKDKRPAIEALALLAPDSAEAAPLLADALGPIGQVEAKIIAGGLAKYPAPVQVSVLAPIARDGQAKRTARQTAVTLLAALAPDHPEAIETLVWLLGESQEYREPAYKAVVSYGTAARDVLEKEAKEPRNYNARTWVRQALKKIASP